MNPFLCMVLLDEGRLMLGITKVVTPDRKVGVAFSVGILTNGRRAYIRDMSRILIEEWPFGKVWGG